MAMTEAGRRRGTGALLLVVSGAALGWWLLEPHSTTTDREQIEAVVARAEEGFETKSVGQVMRCVARDYHDAADLRRDDIRAIVQRVMHGVKAIEVTVEDYTIDVNGSKATGRFDVLFALDEGDGADMHLRRTLDVTFEKRRTGWLSLLGKVWVVTSVDGHGVDKDYEQWLG